MELVWCSPETVTIPNVGTVWQGGTFSIDEDRGRDLVQRGLAQMPVIPKLSSQPQAGKQSKIDLPKLHIDAAPQGKE